MLVLVLVGCGEAAPQRFAGLTRKEAHLRALESARTALGSHRVELVELRQERIAGGGERWLAELHDTTDGSRYCVTVSGGFYGAGTVLAPCGEPVDPAPVTTEEAPSA